MSPDLRKMYEDDPEVKRLIDTAKRLEGLPRHTGMHAAGVVISQKPMDEYVPLSRGGDGTITWTFIGSGKFTIVNAYMKQDGTYTIEGDQLTVTLEAWSDPSTYTFSVDGNSLTMNENSGYGISGTFTKK